MASEFNYVHSCDLEANVLVKIGIMEGSLPKLDYEDLLEDPLLQFSGRKQSKVPDLLIEAQIFSSDTAIHLPVSTSYKSFHRRWEWNEWLKLPVKYSDLPRDATLHLSLFDCVGGRRQKLASGEIVLFGKKGIYKQGQEDIRLIPVTDSTEKLEDNIDEKLAKLTKQYKSGKIPPVEWLDRLTFAEVEKLNQKKKQSSNMLFLMVEFPEVRHEGQMFSIVYFERNGDLLNVVHQRSEIMRIHDPEMYHENLVESKHHKLARARRTGQSEKDLKPNAETRNRLNEILSYPTTQGLTSEEKDLVWQYRFYLSANKKALAKFVKCVNWNSISEANQALESVQRWSPMDVEDALELLGPSFKHPAVRRYAVNRMKSSPDNDLQLYLLQLVQALKYENFATHKSKDHEPTESLTNSFNDASSTSSLPPVTMQVSQEETATDPDTIAAEEATEETEQDSGLAQFLIDRACKNSTIANYFYWYLVIECEGDAQENTKVRDMYLSVLKKFKNALKSGPNEYRARENFLKRQHAFVENLVNLVKAVARESGNRMKKIEKLQHLLASEPKDDHKDSFVKFEALQLPLDPDVKICGVIPKQATLFKSSLMPARLTFITDQGQDYVTLFKHGDDLRQDQLILQIITLMDRILQQENLDLKLTPYRVLATSTRHGFVQFIESSAIADILTKEGSIQNFFRKHNPCETGPYGIQPEVMDTYVKSCAGYCVITYLLGVGDRHLDNLMLRQNGKLFHIDFGYILGMIRNA